MHADARAAQDAQRSRAAAVACFPPSLDANPYLRLLHGALRREGVTQAALRDLSIRSLRAERERVRALHLHWPEPLYRFERGPELLRALLSWVKLVRLVIRLTAARLLGYRVVWTVHQVLPHERRHRGLDLTAAFCLARLASVLTAHDADTAEEAQRRLRVPPARLRVIAHGSYVGVYPPRGSRAEVRGRLDLEPESFVLLSFGELRGHKGLDLLLEAFHGLALPELALIVAGHPKQAAVAETVREFARRDDRIRLLLRFVPDAEVAELYGAADAAVVTRSGGTSGSLVLALSLGLPVIAPSVRAYRDLIGQDGGWLYERQDAVALRAAIAAAAASPAEAKRRGGRALESARALRWETAAAQFAPLLTGAA
ncbi:MAG TPA: glycosyltransferase [Gaiellaceae bacterium]|nr:glycosyltransferase [Gaiellaceae bacterium]